MRRLGLVLPVICGLLACKEDDAAEGTSAGEDTAVTTGSDTDPDPTGSATQASDPSGAEGSATGTGSATEVTTTTTESGGTTSDDTTTDETTEEPPPAIIWSFDDVFGRANVDDDDDNGKEDWLDARFDGDNELAMQVLRGATLDLLPAGARVRLTLGGPGDALRAWIGDELVLGSTQGAPILEHVLTPPGGDVTLAWEFLGHNTKAELTITWLDEQDAEVESVVVDVRASPLITNHHLQPAEHAWVVAVSGGQSYNNSSMVQAMQAVLGDKLTRVPEDDYDYDVWIQDEFEWATARSSDGGRMDVVIDSIRNRGLDPMPEQTLVGPDYVAQTWGEGPKTSYDSFGNLDASPPVTVDGVFYPFGRIYYGRDNGEGINAKMAEFLASQEVQKPFELDTTWLCVGHVDEYSTIVPDPSAPKGFRLLLADVPSMYQLLDAAPKATNLPLYNKDYGYGSIGEIVGDAGLRAYNEDIQADHLDGIRAVFKKELGLDDADIISVPTIFESINNCGAVALTPGTVNLAMFNFAGEPTHAFVPDPFLRATVGDQASDPIIADYKARMPKDLVLHFVDNWNVYHVNLGEVHCGTNVQRAPLANWWEEN
ncbi:MAG TPA: protein-arginine deiminase family protein [Nannocystis sp.]